MHSNNSINLLLQLLQSDNQNTSAEAARLIKLVTECSVLNINGKDKDHILQEIVLSSDFLEVGLDQGDIELPLSMPEMSLMKKDLLGLLTTRENGHKYVPFCLKALAGTEGLEHAFIDAVESSVLAEPFLADEILRSQITLPLSKRSREFVEHVFAESPSEDLRATAEDLLRTDSFLRRH